MEHLTHDELCHLAELVTEGLAYSEYDVELMQHIGQCEQCYQKLRVAMELVVTLDKMSLYAKPRRTKKQNTDSAVIQIVVMDMTTMLKQLERPEDRWFFQRAFRNSGNSASQDKEQNITKLEDADNSRTFVAYNPEKRLLRIQVDAGDASAAPEAIWHMADGTQKKIPLERHGDVFCAEITGLTAGEYQLEMIK